MKKPSPPNFGLILMAAGLAFLAGNQWSRHQQKRREGEARPTPGQDSIDRLEAQHSAAWEQSITRRPFVSDADLKMLARDGWDAMKVAGTVAASTIESLLFDRPPRGVRKR